VSDLECGRRNVSLEVIERLAQALEVSTSRLFARGGEPGGGVPGEWVNILLVEDNADDAVLTRLALKRAKIANQIHLVTDGAAALDYLFCRGNYARRRPDDLPQLILLDLNLPKIGGLEVLRRIKDNERTRGIPVAVLTASSRSQDVAESRRLGADTYVVKPVDFNSLGEVTPKLNFHWALLKPAPGADR